MFGLSEITCAVGDDAEVCVGHYIPGIRCQHLLECLLSCGIFSSLKRGNAPFKQGICLRWRSRSRSCCGLRDTVGCSDENDAQEEHREDWLLSLANQFRCDCQTLHAGHVLVGCRTV